MNANELADWCDEASQEYGNKPLVQVATMLRQQAEQINNLKQWERRQLDVIDDLRNYMKAQDEKIVELAFKLVYVEESKENG